MLAILVHRLARGSSVSYSVPIVQIESRGGVPIGSSLETSPVGRSITARELDCSSTRYEESRRIVTPRYSAYACTRSQTLKSASHAKPTSSQTSESGDRGVGLDEGGPAWYSSGPWREPHNRSQADDGFKELQLVFSIGNALALDRVMRACLGV